MSGQLFEVAPTVPCGVEPIRGGKRFQVLPARGQGWLEARCLDDLVPAEAAVRVYDEIIDLLDVSALEQRYGGGGAPAYPPRFVMKLLVFALVVGVRSAREIARRCQDDVRFIWLAHGLSLDHELFSDFRTRFRKELKALFKQTVMLGVQSGLIRLQQVSIDGSKIAAHARRKTLSAEEIQKLLQRLDERVEQLLTEAAALDAAEAVAESVRRAEEIAQEAATVQGRQERLREALKQLEAREWTRVSETEPEAPLQKTQDGKRPGYNAQIGVDADSGMVVAEALTDAQNDTQQFAPMVQQVVENTGQKPAAAVADSGYESAAALEYLEGEPEVAGYINQQPVGNEGRFTHEDFSYDAQGDRFICPASHELPFKGYKDLKDLRCRLYRASARCCCGCPLRARCITEKARYRQLVLPPHGLLVCAMRRKVATEAGQTALKRRWSTVEPTFGVMKAVLGLRQFLLKGLDGAQTELTLCSLAINVRKLAGWVLNGGQRDRLGLTAASA